ncbi:MAG: flavodoxin domain-containing protein [Gammaproteobacteria bacterium]|nr:MAG: flavodoxin domain-containing protein [Gammaproteobacteria bacterium]
MSANPASTGLLTPEQLARLQALARDLGPLQRAWASGFLAGQGALPAIAGAPSTGARLTVLFGSETGHARGLAARLGKLLGDSGVPVRVLGMGDYRPRELKDERFVLVVTATHGEGDPPEPARGFCEFLMGRKAPRLDELQFAVLGLGDSSYEHFCKTARDIDARLEALGATRLHERRDCDVAFDGPAAEWIAAVVPACAARLRAAGPRPAAGMVAQIGAVGSADAGVQADERSAELPAVVLDHLRLSGRDSDRPTWHIEFDVDEAAARHLPGDALGIVVENDPALADELLDALGLGGDTALADALRKDYEITALTPAFIEAYARAGGVAPLAALCTGKDRAGLRQYLQDRQIADVVREYPVRGLGAAAVSGLLRRLEPRLYSIASSASAHPGEIHVTVAQVAFRSAGGERFGVASGHLTRRTGPEAVLQVYVQPNSGFRLPASPDVPIIMIGAGTGVAPYRAFMQERELQGAGGRSWLVFGGRRFRSDFLYQAEWQRYLKDGLLTRMDVAFSRDQADKLYVQHRLRERGRELYSWLEDGACLYVCGDARSMAPDVHAAFIDIVATHGGRDRESAREYLNELTLGRRYRRDVY